MTNRFCCRWLDKAAQHDDTSLDGAFDRFFSAFVAFNRLYSHLNVTAAHPVRGDRQQATRRIVSIVGAQALLQALREDGREDDIRTLAALIGPGGGFYLISERSVDRPNWTRNQDLLDRLQSESPSTKMEALLEYLYQVRCNMFHGAKDFEQRQLQLVQPATRCLESVVRAGLHTLA
jgi:hypothetical protein